MQVFWFDGRLKGTTIEDMLQKVLVFLLFLSPTLVAGQDQVFVDSDATSTATATQEVVVEVLALPSAINADPIVIPNDRTGSDMTFTRNLESITILNIFAFVVSEVVSSGLPAETVVLVLMIPLLASLLTFTRTIIGLPSLDMLVVIAFSIALLASSLVTGLVLLGIILLASMVARFMLKSFRIMQLPKISLSMFIVSIAVLAGLSLAAFSDAFSVNEISIVPILLLIILSERIVQLRFESSPRNVWLTVSVSLIVGVVGYYLLLSQSVRQVLFNYPELILLLIPINIAMGKYFGLRLTEYPRFAPFINPPKKKKKG